MSKKVLHIGFPKTATSTLQHKIFPELAKILNYDYVDLKHQEYFNLIDINKKKFSELEGSTQIKPLPQKYIISQETLMGREPEFIRFKQSFKTIKKFFSKDCHIIITIRKPSDFLFSRYCHSIKHNRINSIKNYFYISKKISTIPDEYYSKYNLYDFNYEKLIKMYKNHYTKVTVIKFEDLKNLSFLENFEIKSHDSERLKKLFSETKINTQYFNAYQIKAIVFINKFINVKKFNDFLERSLLNINQEIALSGKILSLRILRKIYEIIHIHNLVKKIKFGPKKIPLNIEKSLIDISKLDEDYIKLKSD